MSSVSRARHSGMVLITTLLLLVVVTLLALAMFRSAGLEGRIAGNMMDKQRALQAADTAQQYTEQWLLANVSTVPPPACTSTSFSGATTPLVCSNTLATSTDALSASTVPWDISGAGVGYTYTPTIPYLSGGTVATETLPVNTSGGVDQYYQAPTVYIAQLGGDATVPNAVDYQVDAWSNAGSNGTVAVVESTYQIRYAVLGTGP